MLAAWPLLFALVGQAAPTPAQEAPPPPPPLYIPAYFSLAAPVPVHFKMPTTAGEIAGTVQLVRLEARGLDGRGRLVVRGAIDPSTVKTDDPVLTAHLKRYVLKADKGLLDFGAGARVSPSEDEPRPGFGLFFDQTRRGKYIELRTGFERGPGNVAVLVLDQAVPAAGLGLPKSAHPFIEANGPVRFSARIPLQ